MGRFNWEEKLGWRDPSNASAVSPTSEQRRPTMLWPKHFRIRALLATWLVLIQLVGCATPAVHRKWKGGEFESVQLYLDKHSSPAVIHWRTVSSVGQKTDSIDSGVVGPECTNPVFLAHTREGLKTIGPDRPVVLKAPMTRFKKEGVIPDCHYILFLDEASGDPVLMILSEKSGEAQIGSLAPRNHGFIVLYPVAVLLDVGGLGLLALLRWGALAALHWLDSKY